MGSSDHLPAYEVRETFTITEQSQQVPQVKF